MTVSTDQRIILAREARGTRQECKISTYEWEAFGVPGARLDQELIPPAVQGFETLGVVHVVDKDAAIGSTVERNS